LGGPVACPGARVWRGGAGGGGRADRIYTTIRCNHMKVDGIVWPNVVPPITLRPGA